MQPGSMMMMHCAQGFCAGYSADMTKMAETLDSVTSSAADVYVLASKLSKTKVMEMLVAETWMTPKEAVSLGFATQVGNGKAAKIGNQFDLRMFKNVPEELKSAEDVKLDAEIDAKTDATQVEAAVAAVKAALEAEPDPLINIFRKKLEMLRSA